MKRSPASGTRAAVLALLVAGSLVAGCSDANPAQAEADLATGGLGAGNDVQVTAALTAASTIVKGWQLENGTLPTPAQFATIPGAAASGGATVTYQATATGFCLTATSSGKPTVVRTWAEPGGLQAAGTTC